MSGDGEDALLENFKGRLLYNQDQRLDFQSSECLYSAHLYVTGTDKFHVASRLDWLFVEGTESGLLSSAIHDENSRGIVRMQNEEEKEVRVLG